MQAQVSELLAEYGIPSAAIGVLHDGEITDFAVGVKNLETAEPATTDTIYQCGSMTKTWTALAFMQLVDEGKVGLDEPVRTYLPGFTVADPEVSAKVTPRHLLNHTNGIEEDFGDPGEDDDVYERMVEKICQRTPSSSFGLHPCVQRSPGLRDPRPHHGGHRRQAVGRHYEGSSLRPPGIDQHEQLA